LPESSHIKGSERNVRVNPFLAGDEVEIAIVQRIGDLQWRLLRNTKNARAFNEDCFAHAAQFARPVRLMTNSCDLDGVNAFRLGSETKRLLHFRPEESTIVRLVNTGGRELNRFRKLDPLPRTPLTKSAAVLGLSWAASKTHKDLTHRN
jgi:hypothetical protein